MYIQKQKINIFIKFYNLIFILFLLSCNKNNSFSMQTNSDLEDCIQQDLCGVCNGDNSSCSYSWPIYYDSSEEIAGFQFDIDGEINVINVSGGIVSSSGFMLSTGNNRVLGFHLGGEYIPSGNDLFISLNIVGNGVPCISSEGFIFSSISGNQLEASINNCNTIIIP